MGLAGQDFDEGRAVVEAGVDQKQITFFKRSDQLDNEFVFGGTDLVEDKA